MKYLQNSRKNRSVISGHQVGILGGPLFVIYKILGVIYLAQKENLDPIYWLETNDSDFDEIKFFYYYQDGLKKWQWSRSTRGERIGSLLIDVALFDQIKRYLDSLEQTVYHLELKELILDCFQVGQTLAQANQQFLTWIFSEYSITFFDPQNSDFVAYSQRLLRRELDHTEEGEQANVFALKNNRRLALFGGKNNFLTRSGEKIERNELEKMILLPNFKTRSILQDGYFSVAYYVAGPSEEVYLKGLDRQYRFHQVSPARVVPRMKATLISSSMMEEVKQLLGRSEKPENFLKKLSQEPFLKVREKFWKFQQIDLKEDRQILFQTKNKWVSHYTLSSWEEKKIYNTLRHYLGYHRSELKKSYRSELNTLNQLSLQLYPYFKDPAIGLRQERVYNIVFWLNRYGKDFLKKLEEQYRLGEEKLIYL